MFPAKKAIQKLLGDDQDKKANILLRMYFTTYGAGVILLLSGYDKGTDPSAQRQRRETKLARAMADKAQAGLKARLREEKKRSKA